MTGYNKLLSKIFFTLTAFCLFSSLVFAQSIPPYLPYQGSLINKTAGEPVNQVKTITFALYNTATEGTAIYSQTKEVNITNGVFSVYIGRGEGYYNGDTIEDGIPEEVFIKHSARYLGIKMNDLQTEMKPRQLIASTGYSFKALHADKATQALHADKATQATYADDAGQAIEALNAQKLDGKSINQIIPSGAIVMFNKECPCEWSRLTGFDGKFPRANTSFGGTGGSDAHSHRYNHTHSVGASGSTNHAGSHVHQVCGMCGTSGHGDGSDGNGAMYYWGDGCNSFMHGGGNHSHSVSVSGSTGNPNGSSTDNANSLPPYFNVVFCVKN